jgi:hypothetical protein
MPIGTRVCCTRVDDTKYLHPCGCPTAAINAVSTSKTAELCGFSEFTGFVSTPPKKYLIQTQSGTSQVSKDHGNGNFSTLRFNFGGTRTYDGSTCVLSGGTFLTGTDAQGYTSTSGFGDDPQPGFCVFRDATGASVGSNLQESLTPTTAYLTKTGMRERVVDLGWSYCIDTGLAVLSTEDTEADALARASDTVSDSASSLWEVRSTGFTLVKREVTFTVTCGDLVLGGAYQIHLTVRRRTAVIGSYGAWEDVIVSPIDFTAAGVTYTSDEIILDHIQGWEYKVTGAACDRV